MSEIYSRDCYFNRKSEFAVLTSTSSELDWIVYKGDINPVAYDKRIVQAYIDCVPWIEVRPMITEIGGIEPEDLWIYRQLWVGRSLYINWTDIGFEAKKKLFGLMMKEAMDEVEKKQRKKKKRKLPKTIIRNHIIVPYTTLKNPYEDEYSITILLGRDANRYWFLSGPNNTPNPIGYDREVVELFLSSTQFHNKFDDFVPYVKKFGSSLSKLSEDELWHFWRYNLEAVDVSKNTCFAVTHNGYNEYVEYLNKNREILRVNG